jgi:hypothetical protein
VTTVEQWRADRLSDERSTIERFEDNAVGWLCAFGDRHGRVVHWLAAWASILILWPGMARREREFLNRRRLPP